MSSKRSKLRDPLLIELVAAIGAGRLELGPIHDDGWFVDGYCHENGTVRINLAHHAVSVALHECLHRMRPRFTERGVRARVGRMLRQLSDPEIDTLYNVILSTAQVRKRAETL